MDFLNNVKFTIFHDKHEPTNFFWYILALVYYDLIFFEKSGLETLYKFEQVGSSPILKVWKISVKFQRLLFLSVIISL